MTLQDLSNNRTRIIKIIKNQITSATQDNIKSVMNKMVAMMNEDEKPTMKNIDRLTHKATFSYIKNGIVFTATQNNLIDARLEEKRRQSMPSSLQY